MTSILDRITQVGARLMANSHWTSVTLEAIAEKAGCSDVDVIIRNFGSREGLLMEIAARGVSAMEQRRRTELSLMTPDSSIADLVGAVFEPMADLILEPEHRDFVRLSPQISAVLVDSDSAMTGLTEGTAFGEEWFILREALAMRFGRSEGRRRARWLVITMSAILGTRANDVSMWVGAHSTSADIDHAAHIRGELSHDKFVTEMREQLTAGLLA